MPFFQWFPLLHAVSFGDTPTLPPPKKKKTETKRNFETRILSFHHYIILKKGKPALCMTTTPIFVVQKVINPNTVSHQKHQSIHIEAKFSDLLLFGEQFIPPGATNLSFAKCHPVQEGGFQALMFNKCVRFFGGRVEPW